MRARYGLRPVAIESLRLSLVGRVRGPLGLPAKVEAAFSYVGATHGRWEKTRKLFGLKLGSAAESFDGAAFYRRQGADVSKVVDPLILESAHLRLWAEMAQLLTPLTEANVVLKALDERSFQAMPESEPATVATLTLNEDDTVAAVSVQRYRESDQQVAPYVIRPMGGLQTLNGFAFPRQLVFQWGDGAPEALTVLDAEPNAKIPLTDFTMA
jgi:hypothetical protein